MKKNIILIIVSVIFLLPYNVFAWGVDARNDGNGGWDYYVDYDNNGSYETRTFCLDGDVLDPGHVDTSINLTNSTYLGKVYLGRGDGKAYIAVYRMFLVDGNWIDAKNAMRALTITTGYDNEGTGPGGAKYKDNSFVNNQRTLADNIAAGSNSNSRLTKYYCAGAYAAGLAHGNTTTCVKALSGINKELLKEQDFSVSLVEDTTTKSSNGIHTIKLGGTGLTNINKLFASNSGFSSLKSRSEIKITECSVDNTSAKKGFKCELVGGSKNLLNENQQIKVTNSGSSNSDSKITVTFKYSYKFPFDTSSLTILSCNYWDDPSCAKTRNRTDGYYGKPTQRLMIVNDSKILTGNINISNIEVTKGCERTVGSNNKVIYKYNGKEITNFEDFVSKNKYHCCDEVTLDDLRTFSMEDVETYMKNCKDNPDDEPKTCEVSVGNNNKLIYKYNGTEIKEFEDFLSDKKYNCCKAVNPILLNTLEEVEIYQRLCDKTRPDTDEDVGDDVISLENQCSTKTKLGTKVDKAADGTTFSATTCTNESYVDYTHSFVAQIPMSNITERITRRENGTYKNSLLGIYDSLGIANYVDKSYMQNVVKGKNGGVLAGISAGNNYCMLFTSETDHMYFPGTTVATSGRFFVFNELNKAECINAIEPGANCFRQPYVTGQIYTMMHTNVTKWETDYLAAIEEEKSAYDNYLTKGTTSSRQLYEVAKLTRKTLEQYKTECEQRNDIENYWSYNLNPTLNFSYRQKVYGGTNRTETITETVPMEVSKSAVKYWPRVSTGTSVIANSKSGSKNNKTYTISYGTVNESKTFDTTSNYSVGFTQTVYYKPEKVTYATLPSGQYIVASENYQTSPVYTIENGLRVGYVYNVRLTTYEGAYTTSFNIDQLGHKGITGKVASNVQKALDKYKKDNHISDFSSECVYCNQEGAFERVCDVCPDPNNPELDVKYIYRTISLSDVTPNDRANTNWSDEKGSSAEERIQSLSGDKVVANLSNNGVDAKVSLLGDIDEKSAKVETVANGDIYNDSTEQYLEYEFNLSVKDMRMIKKNTQRADFSYAEFSLCGTSNSTPGKSETANYCFICNADGKECKSTFIDAYGEAATTAITRASKWKYYINNKWEFGSMSSISGFKNGRYPDPTNQEAYLKINKNWP